MRSLTHPSHYWALPYGSLALAIPIWRARLILVLFLLNKCLQIYEEDRM